MTKQRKVLIFESPYAISNYLLKFWQEKANQSIHFKNFFSVALSGGKTPLEFYCLLSNVKSFDLWSQTHIFWADERFVPASDPASNFRMIKETLLSYVNIPPENIHPVPTEVKTATLAAERYREVLTDCFGLKPGQFPKFDLMLLGIGEDGHTASLFPEQNLEEVKNSVVIPVSLNKLEQERISLSLSTINSARNVVFLALGPNKADIIERVLEKNEPLPAGKVQPIDGELVFLLDRDAASRLSFKDSYVLEHNAIAVFK